MNTTRLLVAPLSLLLVLAACAAPAGEVSSPSPTATDDPTPSPSASPEEDTDASMPDAPANIPDRIWAGIIDELADLEDSDEAPTVVTAEAVTWSDGSLGCPQPDMGYTQALVPGYRVVIEVDGEELHFHASESGTVILCDDPQPPADDGT